MEEERKELNPFILYYYNIKRQKARIENSPLECLQWLCRCHYAYATSIGFLFPIMHLVAGGKLNKVLYFDSFGEDPSFGVLLKYAILVNGTSLSKLGKLYIIINITCLQRISLIIMYFNLKTYIRSTMRSSYICVLTLLVCCNVDYVM